MSECAKMPLDAEAKGITIRRLGCAAQTSPLRRLIAQQRQQVLLLRLLQSIHREVIFQQRSRKRIAAQAQRKGFKNEVEVPLDEGSEEGKCDFLLAGQYLGFSPTRIHPGLLIDDTASGSPCQPILKG